MNPYVDLEKYIDLSKLDYDDLSYVDLFLMKKYFKDETSLVNGVLTEKGLVMSEDDLLKNYLCKKFLDNHCFDKVFEKMDTDEDDIKSYLKILTLSNMKLLQFLNEKQDYLNGFIYQVEEEINKVDMTD